ncbi:MAG TPA: hypothetical protein VD970_02725 [Acetobacteraceae bacterium]|nr:hypothetical protein [Acetobacteraceae bacterium]
MARLLAPVSRVLVALILASLPMRGPALAQEAPAQSSQRRLWFDPTQLPRFTGTVERYLPAPAGGFDSLLLREGVQVLFPAEIGETLRQAVPQGRPIFVWGIRARSAPVITMLAWAPTAEEEPRFVERPSWWAGTVTRGQTRISVQGTVRHTLHNSRGDVTGAMLDDGTVVRLPAEVAAARHELLRPGARLAATGWGVEGEGARALSAETIGDSPQNMTPVPHAPEGAAPPRR